MTIQEIKQRHEKLFYWAEQAFQDRIQEPSQGDPMEAAMLMEAILASLTACYMSEQSAQTEMGHGWYVVWGPENT